MDKNNGNREVPLSWFTKSLKKFIPSYIELFFLAACLRLIGLVEPFIFQVIIDRILPFQREESLIVVIIIFAVVILFQMGFETLSSLLGALTANKVTQEFGWRIFDQVFKLPLRYFRKWSVGETIQRIRETDTIRDFLVGTSIGTTLDLLFIFLYLAVLFSLSPTLTTIVLIALPLQFTVYIVLGSPLRKRLRFRFDAAAKHQSHMIENISGIASIKAIGAESHMLEQLNGTLENTLSTGLRVTKLNILSTQLSLAIEMATKIAVIYIGSLLVFNATITLGQMIAFYLISEKVADPISNFSKLWDAWQNMRISRQRLGDILNEDIEPFEKLPRLPLSIKPILTFENVCFSYSEEMRILNKFSFTAKVNSLNLIIGPSGIGKSTFGRLAAGIDVPNSGTILLDGHDISQYNVQDVRSKIAYIPQEPYLFSGTLRESLLIGNEDKTDDDLRAALKISAAEYLIDQLPFGLDTDIGERGSTLSGGQRQRIAIARSLLKLPKILVLDEPTNALDDKAQIKMADELIKLKAGATIIIITHRPEIFNNPDQVVNFERLL